MSVVADAAFPMLLPTSLAVSEKLPPVSFTASVMLLLTFDNLSDFLQSFKPKIASNPRMTIGIIFSKSLLVFVAPVVTAPLALAAAFDAALLAPDVALLAAPDTAFEAVLLACDVTLDTVPVEVAAASLRLAAVVVAATAAAPVTLLLAAAAALETDLEVDVAVPLIDFEAPEAELFAVTVAPVTTPATPAARPVAPVVMV